MPEGSGTTLGQARGVVVIEASLAQAQQQIAAFSTRVEQQMAQVSASSQRAGVSIGSLNQVAGALGIGLGIAQLGKAALAANELATSYNRQRLAAENLAGSQAQLNALLAVYDRDTGGILSKSAELQNVTQLLSVGFADSTTELDKFATAIRGISIATGRSSDIITQNLILELFSQRGQRLDQLGLEYDKVRQRSEELQAADSSLTQQMAYQQAVLDEAQRKFGALSNSAEGQATEVEKLRKVWADLTLEIGQGSAEAINTFAKSADDQLTHISELVRQAIQDFNNLQAAYSNATGNKPGGAFAGTPADSFLKADPIGNFARQLDKQLSDWLSGQAGQVPRWMTGVPSSASGPLAPSVPGDPSQSTEAKNAAKDWATKTEEIETQANKQRLEATRNYESQRSRTIEQYEENVARSAADFAKNRMRAQEDYENSILDIMREAQRRDERMAADHDRQMARMQSDSAKRLADLQENLDRGNAQRRADSAEKIADLSAEHDADIADKRADSVQKLLDIEKDYERQRLRSARDHNDSLSDAASRLDANAVFQEQHRFQREQEDAAQSHQEKVDDEKKKLQDGIDNLNEAYNKKLADEQKSLQKSIDQANEAYQRQVKDENEALQQRIDDANEAYAQQLQDAKDADAQRITDMAAHFEEQKRREDADQVDRMTRMAADHVQEMTQQDTEHAERLTQISTHAQAERDQNDTEFEKQLTALGVHNTAWETAQDAHQKRSLDMYQLFLRQQEEASINSQIRQLNTKLGQTGLSPFEVQEFNANIFLLQKALEPLNKEIGDLEDKLATPAASSTVAASAIGVIGAAGLGATSVSGAGAITINAPITINGVSSKTAAEIVDIIDDRVDEIFTVAARFGSGR